MSKPFSYKRVLLKLSGEILLDGEPFGIQPKACLALAKSIQEMKETGLEVALVIGGGNIFRGLNLTAKGIERTPADQMGMLATLMNGIALQETLESVGCTARVMTALECPRVAETYTWNKAQEYLRNGDVLIFVGGTGNPYFTTDTAAALRASEIHADILLKATKVDGVYNKDPLKYSDAKKYQELSYSQFLSEKLELMDATAVALCRSSHIPILVFNMKLLKQGKIVEVIQQPHLGTLLKGD